MADLFASALDWWRGGDLLMPVMLGVAVVLYTLIGERAWTLWGQRRRVRGDELQRLLTTGPSADHAGWRIWAGRYVGVAEEAELTRGLGLIRTLAACLPLLGLLGTVTGMVDSFGAMAGSGRGGVALAREAGAGIGLALTATQYGIALAVPAVVAEWLLRRRAEALAHHRELVVRSAIAGSPS